MKKFILLLCLISSNAYSEEYVNQMSCEKTSIIFDGLKKEYGEIPVVLGKADDIAESVMSIWTNPKTNTWSIVATKDEISCIVGTGKNFKVIDYRGKKLI